MSHLAITFIFRILTHRKMNTKGDCYPKSIILLSVYFKLKLTLSYRDFEEIMKISGVIVDHATIQQWVYNLDPFRDECFFIA